MVVDERRLERLLEDRSRIYGRWRGREIEALRRKLGLRVADFANWVGVASSTIYQWEGGKKVSRRPRTPSDLAQRALHQLEQFFFPRRGRKEIF